jgi:tetratricopeptide (TPR) repeat protein
MDRPDIGKLHQQATDHYLRGEYAEAIEAWNRVLAADPQDVAAIEGIRMSRTLLGSESPGPADDPSVLRRRIDEVESRIEAGDLHGAVRAAEALAEEFPSEPDAISTLARARLEAGDSDEAADACARLLSLSPEYAEAAKLLEECRHVSPAESPLGAVTMRETAPPAAPSVDPAVGALQQRVGELLAQARSAASHGRNEEAMGVISRLLILDDTNADALALEEDLRKKAEEAARNVEGWLLEGVQCLEQRRFEDARQLFLRVLERSPGHAEALDFLEKADAALALREQENLTQPERPKPAAPALDAPAPKGTVWQPGPGPAADAAPAAEPRLLQDIEIPSFDLQAAAAASAPAEEPAPGRPAGRFAWVAALLRPERRVVVLACAGVLVTALLGLAGWKLLFAGSQAALEDEPALALPKKASRAAPPVGPTDAKQPQEPAEPSAQEQAAKIAAAIARGSDALDAKDFAAAVVAYDEALTLDPTSEAARKGLLDAGDRYKKSRAEAEKLDKGKRAFAAGEYESALRLFYRVPAGVADPALLNRYKVAGWYNLGIVALRAADCAHAFENFGEAMALNPGDPEVRDARAMADRCGTQKKDRAFYDAVEGMPFRELD